MNRRGRLGGSYCFRILAGAVLAIGTASAGSLFAQTYPVKPVRVIVPYPAGSATEIFARVISQRLGEIWKTGVVVESIAGAGGVVGTQAIAKAPADGYSLGWVASPHAINAALYSGLPYDSIKDFRPIASIAATALVVVARPSFPPNTIAELVALAKASPGKVNYASNGIGSSSQLATELLASHAGVKFTHVPYKNTGQLNTDLMSGQVEIASIGVSVALPLFQSGRLKPLGVTSAKRAGLLPNVPAVAETLPGYESKAWMGFIAPAGVPDAIVAKVQTDAMTTVNDPGVASAMSAQALEIDLLDSAQFARRIENDIRTWKKIVADVGIKVE